MVYTNNQGEAIRTDPQPEKQMMTTSFNDDTITVTDAEGGIWWPNQEAEAEIMASEDPEAKAIEICHTQPMRGTWQQ